jgi:short-subunit dehydrogenase
LAFTLEEHSRSNVTTIVADLSIEADLRRVQNVFAERGDISILVKNAGVGALGPTLKVDASAVENLVKVNVLALTTLSLAALSAFKARGHGLLVNIASIIALGPSEQRVLTAGRRLTFSISRDRSNRSTPIAELRYRPSYQVLSKANFSQRQA